MDSRHWAFEVNPNYEETKDDWKERERDRTTGERKRTTGEGHAALNGCRESRFDRVMSPLIHAEPVIFGFMNISLLAARYSFHILTAMSPCLFNTIPQAQSRPPAAASSPSIQ